MPKSTLSFPELCSKEKPMSVPFWIVRLSGAQSKNEFSFRLGASKFQMQWWRLHKKSKSYIIHPNFKTFAS